MSTPNDSISITDAVERDATALSKMGGAAFIAAFGFSLSDNELDAYLFENYRPSILGAEIANSASNHYFVARAGEAIVGFLQLKFDSSDPCLPKAPTLEIRRVYVDSQRLSEGIGGKLMDHAMAYFKDWAAKTEGRAGIWLGCWERNEKAQRFYARYGFEKIGEHGFPIASRVDTDWIMFRWEE